MPRYFLEVAYNGKGYSGFQVQDNAVTIQSEVERSFQVLFRKPVELTGSSRTDAGVHALQNYFHFDWHEAFDQRSIYNLNAILPAGIVINKVVPVSDEAHARFHATSRVYNYHLYSYKNPFMNDRAWYFPYILDEALLHETAALIKQNQSFHAFSKRNTQVHTFDCKVVVSRWIRKDENWVYEIEANRFLRGMVRGLVGTMVKVARGNLSLEAFKQLLAERELAKADFSAPAEGLFLVRVNYPGTIFTSL